MKKDNVRVRFAPSPTGFMHLGNVRAALINYIFARQKDGAFILRIEDTDQQRNIDPSGKKIIEDLTWLGLDYDEGPLKGGPHSPYMQSERAPIYQKHLQVLQEKNAIYRCFCTADELEKRRQRQLALKQPPRYDRTCKGLSADTIKQNLQENTPFIWRFYLDENQAVSFFDLARKTINFELKHFSDFALTRQDGSFTFMFANFVDDLEMRITHIFRGEDHLTNTAGQVALYHAFDAQVPVFWHLPIITNHEGKKLSKRDFGFSLTDLKHAGFLPEAIVNYLAVIGGSFTRDIVPIEKLIATTQFDELASAGQICYDLEQLQWLNHHWIMQYNLLALTALCHDYLREAYPKAAQQTTDELILIIKLIQPELVTLKDCVAALAFYYCEPIITQKMLHEHKIETYGTFLTELITQVDEHLNEPEVAVKLMQKSCKDQSAPIKDIFSLIRLALTGKPQGPSVKDLIIMLGTERSRARLQILKA